MDLVNTKWCYDCDGPVEACHGCTISLREENQRLRQKLSALTETLEDIATGEHYDEAPENAELALKACGLWNEDE